jgi:hypothetical protein
MRGRDPRFHRGSDTQRPMDANEVVPGAVEADRLPEVPLLAESFAARQN